MNIVEPISPLVSLHWPDDTPVLRGDALRRAEGEGMPVPRFGDGIWDLRAHCYRENILKCQTIINFHRRFPDPARNLLARELAMQRLNAPVAPIRQKARLAPASVITLGQNLRYLPLLFRFMDEAGLPRLDGLRQDHFDQFARYLLETRSGDRKYVAHVLVVLVWLYEARDLLTLDRIVVPPWNGRSIFKAIGAKQPDENLTPRIPEHVMGPLLRWAVAYVDVFAADILAVYRANRDRLAAASPATPPRSGPRATRERLSAYFDGLAQSGGKVPSVSGSGTPNMLAIRAAAGVRGHDLRDHRDLIEAAVRRIGLDDAPFDTPVSAIPGTQTPWRPRFGASRDVHIECRCLTAACYIVCAYLSGMRDSEVQAMKENCHEVLRDRDGAVVRHYVRSVEYKGKHATGVERTWVVIEQVTRATSVMRELGRDVRAEWGTDLLFVLVHHGRENARLSLKTGANRFIAEFIEHVNTRLAPVVNAPNYPAIPVGAFGPVTTRMFRRTVAWHIANRPFGCVAGMVQYGHMSATMFEGYAGTSDSGFREEVEAERAFARQHDIVAMFEDWKRGVRPTGPMGPLLDDEFRYIREEIGDFPGRIVDEARRDKMLRHLRTMLFPGLLADCFFDPRNAVCLSHVKEPDRSEPVVGICDPHCANACWAKKHLPVWEQALADVERLAKRNRISCIQRDILNRKRAEYSTVISAIREASDAGAQEAR
jgi:integrase